MKKLLFILILLIFNTHFLFAQNKESLVKDIRVKYNLIRNGLNSYDTTMVEIWGESTEGGQATGFYDGSELKMIEVVWLGEMEKNTIEYYFDKGRLFFAFAQDFKYNRPMYWNKQRAEENGDNEVFDPNKTVVKEDRYYFYEEKLFLWLNNEKKEVDLQLKDKSDEGRSIMAHSYKMKEELKK